MISARDKSRLHTIRLHERVMLGFLFLFLVAGIVVNLHWIKVGNHARVILAISPACMSAVFVHWFMLKFMTFPEEADKHADDSSESPRTK
ncbi:hypothetical protein BH09SUM1_BH09SUM1_19610 [soil metagenome]